jgi:murein DD-endopeptidase MepM/ murein hydrolase activator NlpD
LRKQVLDPRGYTHDGSTSFDKDHSGWSIVAEAVVVILFTLVCLFLIAVAILEPFGVARAQELTSIAQIDIGRSRPKPRLEIGGPDGMVIGKAALIDSSSVPNLWPVTGRLTDGFGGRRNPFGRRSSEFHAGLDIAAAWGTPVTATADGIVEFAGRKSGYGQVVIVDHGGGIQTRYGHLSRIEVRPGQTLKGGDQIGCVGSTGRSTGPHLHYEVRVGEEPVNPMAYLAQ